MSKVDGSIIRSTGLLASPSSTASEDASPARALNEGTPFTISDGQSEDNGDTNGAEKGKTAGHVAKTVFSFVNGAKAFADEMDSGDEVKLLRMRTKRNEIVIVPGKTGLALECWTLWLCRFVTHKSGELGFLAIAVIYPVVRG